MKKIEIYGLSGMPLIKKGDNFAEIILKTAKDNQFVFQKGDVLVIAQKAISKSEGSFVSLKEIIPSSEAINLSEKTGRDPRLCQIYINESSKILRTKGRMVITIHRLGFECTGAGVDRSNIAPHEEEIVCLLPENPDLSAKRIRETLEQALKMDLAVIVNDSFGRRDREGSIGIAIGISGIGALEIREQKDLFENPSKSMIALVDELSAAASTMMGQADEGMPVVIIRGANYQRNTDSSIKDILIQQEE